MGEQVLILIDDFIFGIVIKIKTFVKKNKTPPKNIIVMNINAEGKEILNDITIRAKALKIEFDSFTDRLNEFLEVK